MVKKMSFNRKYITKRFILKKFLVSEYIFKLACFCESCRELGIDMFHVKCFRLKIFEQIGIGMAYLHIFLITMHEINTAEVYLKLFQTYMLELFCENS